MGFSKKASIFVTALLAAVANGHMILKTPTPYGKSSLNSSPLDPSGSDFPCKLRSGAFDKEGAENVMAIGEPQTLSFTGSAVHGGGSCQVALTTDLAPTKDSKWMVIKSIIGGCPANVPGNLPPDPNGNGASTFQYSIPEGIAPGEYTLSWSWLNKVGNREFYQNCAPVTVSGAKRKRYAPAPKPAKRQTNFPGLVVANLASINSCHSPENFEVAFPNPGADAQTAGNGPYTSLAGCEVGGGGGGAAPQQPTNAPSSPGASQTYGQPSYGTGLPTGTENAQGKPTGDGAGNPYQTERPTYNGNPQQTASPGVFADGSNAVTPVTTAAASTPTSVDTKASGNDTGSSSEGQTGDCTEGAWNCIDGTSFQRCASGSWSVAIPMAAGMKCVPGISANFAQSAGKVKRHSHGGHFRFLDSLHH
jgi:hypothetical protein